MSPALSDVAQLGGEVRSLAGQLRLAREAAPDAPAVLIGRLATLESRLDSLADRLEGAETGIVATTAAHVTMRASQNDPGELATTTTPRAAVRQEREPDVEVAQDDPPRRVRVRRLRLQRDAKLAGLGALVIPVLAILLERLAHRLGVLP